MELKTVSYFSNISLDKWRKCAYCTR